MKGKASQMESRIKSVPADLDLASLRG